MKVNRFVDEGFEFVNERTMVCKGKVYRFMKKRFIGL